MKRILTLLILLAILAGAGTVFVKYYSYLFAKDVEGVIVKVERVTNPNMVINAAGGTPQVPANQLYSFAVSIRDSKGEIHTASSEDRQWAVVSSGQCAKAKFYPYAPWELDKSGTYFGARLLSLHDCPKQ